MSDRSERLRLIHLAFVVAVLAVGFAVLLPSAAAFYASWIIIMCAVVALGRASVTELYVVMAVLFPILWLLSEAVKQANGTA
jgi:hypothetical protein